MKIFNKENQFYPTPQPLIEKLLEDIDFRSRNYHKVLEPSAGKADIADYISQQSKFVKVDCIEINPELTHILKGKGYKVIHDDFLTFDTYKSYNLIVGNPPFNMGSFHANHAISLMERRSGKIRFILNAETIRNPYSNSRKLLARKIEQYNGEVEFVANGFSDAEHKTDVEVAIVRIDIPEQKKSSDILENLRAEQEREKRETETHNDLIEGSYIEGVISQYNLEIKAGILLIEEFEAFNRVNLRSFDEDESASILEMSIEGSQRGTFYDIDELINTFIEKTRSKYWRTLFRSKDFAKLFTNKARYEYYDKIEDLKNYDFTHYNIKQIQEDLSRNMQGMVEETIIELFDKFTSYHQDEYSSNVHLFDGWKTNRSYKLNEKKCILPLSAYNQYDGRLDLRFNFRDMITDIYKVFVYLSGGDTTKIERVASVLKDAQDTNTTKNIDLDYFVLDTFKKGTTHFKWKDKELMHKFNIYGCQKKGWLPYSYGKQNYEDMDEESKSVIDDFEGKESYNKVMNNKELYIQDNNQLLMLGGGQ